jgi:hypothetical protein
VSISFAVCPSVRKSKWNSVTAIQFLVKFYSVAGGGRGGGVLKSALEVQVWLKSDKNKRHFKIRPKYMYD